MLPPSRTCSPFAGDPGFRAVQLGELEQLDLAGKERTEHDGRRAPALRHHPDTLELMPVLETEGGVVPQGFEFVACKIGAGDIGHLDRSSDHLCLSGRDEDIARDRYIAISGHRASYLRAAFQLILFSSFFIRPCQAYGP